MGFLVKVTLIITLVTLFFAYSPTLIEFKPQAYKLRSTKLTGPLEINTRLSDGERLFEGKILGPESLVSHKGNIYTGTADGCIIKIQGDKMTCIAQVNKECDSSSNQLESQCSRPLGLRFDKKGTLYVADKHKGIYTVNITTGQTSAVLSSDTLVEGKRIGFVDDLDIDDEGIIYISDATTRWKPNTSALIVVEHENSGRVIRFNPKTKMASVLIDSLYFPNGIQISRSGESLLIAEFTKNRIHRYYLKGLKKNQFEVFTEVPGSPDNIRPSKYGYWIALLRYHNSSDLGLMHRLSRYPLTRKIIFRFQHTVGSLLFYLHQYWNSQELLNLSHQLREGRNWLSSPHPHGMAVEVDEEGKIIQSIQSPDGKHGFISEILEYDGYLYAGSFVNPYLIRIKQR